MLSPNPITTLRPNTVVTVKPLPTTSTQKITTATRIVSTTGKIGNSVPTTTIIATTIKGAANAVLKSTTTKPTTEALSNQNPTIAPKPMTTQKAITTTKTISATLTGQNTVNSIKPVSTETVRKTTIESTTGNIALSTTTVKTLPTLPSASSRPKPTLKPLPTTSTQKITITTAKFTTKSAAATFRATNKPSTPAIFPTKSTVIHTSPIPVRTTASKPHL